MSESMYKTGFCAIGACEGTAPLSMSGVPMKVCVAHEICTCTCHNKFNAMYKMAGEERHLHQNPNYTPAPSMDLSEYFTVAREIQGESLGPTVQVVRASDKPSEATPGLLVTSREFTTTESGARQRGQLEAQVQDICNRAMYGEFDELMTPQAVSVLIDPERPPSTGAIGAVFNRWEEIGYAKIHRKPLYFRGLTIEGMRDGLEACKRRAKR